MRYESCIYLCERCVSTERREVRQPQSVADFVGRDLEANRAAHIAMNVNTAFEGMKLSLEGMNPSSNAAERRLASAHQPPHVRRGPNRFHNSLRRDETLTRGYRTCARALLR